MLASSRLLVLALLLWAGNYACSSVLADEPIQVHPSNSCWFLHQGRCTALITAAEHYGAVINLDFDYERYLRSLNRDGMNYTRIFAGSYLEPPGAFGILRNNLAPQPDRFLSPFEREGKDGSGRYDLSKYNPRYLQRLNKFVSLADELGIVVELTFFTSIYSDKQWAIHPFNPSNNVHEYSVERYQDLQTDKAPKIAQDLQSNWVAHLVQELNHHNNLFFEIQNEPWSDNHVMGEKLMAAWVDRNRFPNVIELTQPTSIQWQRMIADRITETEKTLPKKHLIAQNICNTRLSVGPDDLVPQASLLNFHYATAEAVQWNRGKGRVIGYDETGFAGSDPDVYLQQAWRFVMAGGGLFNHLDYSFSVGHEDGDDSDNKAPGAASPELRSQLRTLSEFVHSFDLVSLRPMPLAVQQQYAVNTQTLGDGRSQFAIYAEGRSPASVVVRVPQGNWQVSFLNPDSGQRSEPISLQTKQDALTIELPSFDDAIAIDIRKSK
ncbi:cellulase family glycosylhydrolase [Rubripirellula amarantea]|nr:cellulase family glycosylhydrolase [Rubripirellula amarantea]